MFGRLPYKHQRTAVISGSQGVHLDIISIQGPELRVRRMREDETSCYIDTTHDKGGFPNARWRRFGGPAGPCGQFGIPAMPHRRGSPMS